VLDAWDGTADLDSPGAPLWREFSTAGGIRWATAFDPDDPVRTPGSLAPAPTAGLDPTLESLARAVQVLRAAGHGPDATLRSLQATVRAGQRIPVPGDNQDSALNIVGWATVAPVTSLDPAPRRIQVSGFAQGSGLSRITGDADFVGYPVDYGNSFMLAVEWGPGGPEGESILAYGTTSDETDPQYVEATKRFADKEWTPVAFTPAEVSAAAVSTITVHG
jgi:acyl-homoserine-lactone acylase